MKLEISVIIPVFNAARFIENAVSSAAENDTVREIVLVEDGSQDDSPEICRRLESENEKVRLLSHEGGMNRGAAASRNLGMQHAANEFISFLDADDAYLPNRFETDYLVFRDNEKADGSYNCVAAKIHDNLQEKYEARFKSGDTTLSRRVPPDELLDVLLNIHPHASGHIHLNGLTLKKNAVSKVGFQNEKLRLHQDTEWCYRLAHGCRLFSGSIEDPVAIRNVHSDNRYLHNERHNYTRFLMYTEIIRSGYFTNYSFPVKKIFLRRWLFHFKKHMGAADSKEYLPLVKGVLSTSAVAISSLLGRGNRGD